MNYIKIMKASILIKSDFRGIVNEINVALICFCMCTRRIRFSSSSSLPYGAMPVYPGPQRNGSDISLDLTPLSLLTGASPLPASSTPLHKLTRLERVALEIVETEQAYVRDLKSIVEVRIRHSMYHVSYYKKICIKWNLQPNKL